MMFIVLSSDGYLIGVGILPVFCVLYGTGKESSSKVVVVYEF
jgi:hypothetical protein